MAFRLLSSAIVLAALVGGSDVAIAQSGGRGPDPASPLVERAREAFDASRLPTRVALPAGALSVEPAEQLAAVAGATVRLEVVLDRPAEGAALIVTLPRRFVQTPASEIPFAGEPTLAPDSGDEAELDNGARSATLELGTTAAGETVAMTIEVGGLPAGTYDLPLRWRDSGGAVTRAGKARIRLYAPRRESEPAGVRAATSAGLVSAPMPGFAVNASNDGGEQSETFIAVTPLDSHRVLAAANNINPPSGADAFLSNDGGKSFGALRFAALDESVGGRLMRAITLNAPGGIEQSYACCNMTMTADDLGNLWLGGLSRCRASAPSRIFVNRIAAGTNALAPVSAGLPVITRPTPCGADSRANVLQDKPMMTIDNAPSSPTYGRLYVSWNSPELETGNLNIVISACDTRDGGLPDAQRCDLGANWSAPVVVSGPPGSYITSAPATGPDGAVYVAWWDFSATNAVRIARCRAGCVSPGAWEAPRTVALLDDTDGPDPDTTSDPIPFSCPIVAQPGGRAAPVPSVAVDRSGGPRHGRLFVGWADLRPGSGSTRCGEISPIESAQPAPSHLTFDAYAATGTFEQITTGALRSAQRGTRVVADAGVGDSPNNSDEFLSWVSVDQTTGEAWTDTYSTAGDATRRTTAVLLRRIVVPASGTRPTYDSPETVSGNRRTNYSTNPCCTFGNDYGDYTGLDAADGEVFPVWTDRPGPGSDGDVFVRAIAPPTPHLVAESAALAEAPGASGDGVAGPGEPFALTLRLRNTGALAQTNVQAVALSSPVPGLSIDARTAPYGTIVPGASADNAAAFTGTLPAGIACGRPVDLRVTLATGERPRRIQFTVTPGCPPATPSPSGAVAGITAVPRDRRPPRVRLLSTLRTLRLGRDRIVRFPLAAPYENVRGTITLRSDSRVRIGRRRVLLRIGTASFRLTRGRRATVRIRVGPTTASRVRRLRRLRVRATVTYRDGAGNRATRRVRLTLVATARRR